MSHLLYIWGVVQPIKWVGHSLKCAVHSWKYLLSGFGVGMVWVLSVRLCESLMVVWCGTKCARLHWDCGGLGLEQYPLRKCLFCVFDLFVNVSSACVWRPGRFFSWSCYPLTESMRYLAILVDSSLGVSIGTQLHCGYSFYWPETSIPPVVHTWNFRHL